MYIRCKWNTSWTPGLFIIALLVFKDDVRKPDGVVRDTDDINAKIIRCIPDEAIISPLLWMTFERKVVSDT